MGVASLSNSFLQCEVIKIVEFLKEEILKKRNKQGTWNLQAKHPGQEHFEMEKAGQPSRWNTLRALRVLGYYDMDLYSNS